jgi:hypothetical protein
MNALLAPCATACALAIAIVAAWPQAGTARERPRGAAGALLRAHRVPSPIGAAGRMTRILYRSADARGRPASVSGTVLVPRGRPPARGWPVLSWAHGTTGIADRCAPSRTASHPTSPIQQQVDAWVREGYAVARTDYAGLGTPGTHAYLNGPVEGRNVIDIVTAARRLDPGVGRRWVAAGHSQGGQAALFAGHLAARRAPGLRLRGVAAFAPASHVGDLARALLPSTATSPVSGYGALVIAGAAAASPRVRLGRIESPAALGLRPLVDRRCLQDLERPGEFGGLSPAQLVRPGADLRPLYRVLDAENPARRIPAPVRLFQGAADTTVPRPLTDRLAGELRRRTPASTTSAWSRPRRPRPGASSGGA